MNTAHAASRSAPPRFRLPRVALGALAVGTFDLVFACAWWAVAAKVAPVRIFQSIAAGLYGDASFDGGVRTATIGVIAHYFIAACMVLAYALAASRLPTLIRFPWRWGAAYGLVLYAAMNFVVVPLSAAGPAPVRPAWMIASVMVHAIIGIACAFIARGALRDQ
ncbi:putative membrane protein [Lysobacter dokdonensis DS-58]|uniref:Putative membrane protein n=1 Tax=Lysobacter dokdonensis DS-58 TaxID=1300345 RepID=A0A0A2WLE5_9GAMM|nr:hypothetical protein [Lysobacter dokdonensis]KGQ19542.1 putative membrane protein [Lysobacter dokdonensis DS-58]